MPAPSRTTDAAIVAAARALLERLGPTGVTMQAVGAAVGIRGPSLYKRFADRAALLRAVEAQAVADLARRLGAVVATDPAEALAGMAAAYRGFAHEAPAVYALLFAPDGWDMERDAWRAEAAAPLLRLAARLAAPHAALPAGRLLTAFMHGWVSMELAGAFRLGGDAPADFCAALAALHAGCRAMATFDHKSAIPPATADAG